MIVNEELHSCAPYRAQPCNFDTKTCTRSCNHDATKSIKELALKALNNIPRCNQYATTEKNACNIDAIIKLTDIPLKQLKKLAGDDWEWMRHDPAALKAFVSALRNNRIRAQGQIPETYTSSTRCKNCGIVPIPPEQRCGGYVVGCMWCANKLKGLPIPAPPGLL